MKEYLTVNIGVRPHKENQEPRNIQKNLKHIRKPSKRKKIDGVQRYQDFKQEFKEVVRC